jgi:hypothetical protein
MWIDRFGMLQLALLPLQGLDEKGLDLVSRPRGLAEEL